jgi:Glycosyltransferase family 87
MPRVLRENAVCALAAAAGCASLAWLGLSGFVWSDYEVEQLPAVNALLAGHLGRFLSLAPVYGGSLIERAPFALMPGLWGGGETATYRMLALPCLLASALLGVWLVARMRTERRSLLARAVTLGLCVANPVTLNALELGHPEELLGACLCVAALLVASASTVSRRRALAAGLLLGLAIANKQWALLAAPVLLMALPTGRRTLCLLAAFAVAALIQAPLLLSGSGTYTAGAAAVASSSSAVFQPEQIWWFLGHHGALVHGLFGNAKPGFRVAPAWANQISHPLVLLAGVAIAAMLWLRTGGRRLAPGAALLAFAVTMLVRCLLDTWDIGYYLLPGILALLAWEANDSSRRPPLITLALSLAAWAQFRWLPGRISPDAQSAVFLAWTLPLLAALAARLLSEAPRKARPPGISALLPERPRLGLRPQETTVSSFESPSVSTSQPPSRTTVRSSIRTPSTSGR